MKKTLIAIAALAATSAFAQSTVTISGTYNAAFQKAATGAKSADLVDSNITFAAVEDLGGGLKASVSSQIQAGGRQDISTAADTSTNVNLGTVGNQAKKDGVYGRNASVGLSGGFGAVSIGRLESTNTTEKAIVAPIWLAQGFDRAHLLGAKANYQVTSYTAPAMSGVTLGVSRSTLLNSDFAPAAGTADAQLTVNGVSAAYVNGPLTVDFVTKCVENGTTSKGTKNEYAATYTAGALKLGAAVSTHSGAYYTSTTVTGNNTLLSAAYAVTPQTTVGFANVKRADGQGVTGAKGNAVAVEYAFSKRTQLNATMGKMQKDGDTANNYSQYRVGIKHAF